VHHINKLPYTVLHNKSQHEVSYGTSPDLQYLIRIFGCLIFTYTIQQGVTKLNPGPKKCVRGFILMDFSTREIFLARNIHFYEYFLSLYNQYPINNFISCFAHSIYLESQIKFLLFNLIKNGRLNPDSVQIKHIGLMIGSVRFKLLYLSFNHLTL
jgi:hypothetical protein